MSFPVQMLGKSFKMMPVMLWGIVISSLGLGLYSPEPRNQCREFSRRAEVQELHDQGAHDQSIAVLFSSGRPCMV